MKAEKATRLMLTASSISSIDIRMTMTFLRLRKMPKIAEREQDRGNREVVAEPDGCMHGCHPPPA